MTLEQRGRFVLACMGLIAAVALGLWATSPAEPPPGRRIQTQRRALVR
jgi:hypothetical protein